MLGRIDQLWDNETDKGKPYQVLAIGDERYSFWDKKQFGKFRKGDTVEFDWKQSGEYKNITTIDLTETGSNASDGSNDKNERIVKMSSLKTAGMVLGPLDMEPREKVLLTVDTARYFEKYINDELDNEPSGNSKVNGKNKDRKHEYRGTSLGL
ncbi:MAG: hypothetical protein ACFFDP_02645 [Promethearchaeota archaeon]